MRNIHSPRLEDQGAITIGAHHYWVQHYYPNGGSRCLVYVFKPHTPQSLGKVFASREDYMAWAKTVPTQLNLWS
jgi:hypothetical protein